LKEPIKLYILQKSNGTAWLIGITKKLRPNEYNEQRHDYIMKTGL